MYYFAHGGPRSWIKVRQLHDQMSLLKDFVKFIGPSRLVSDVSTVDLQNYRKKLIRSGKSPNTINNRIAAVKSMYHWAIDNEIVDRAPNLKAIKKIAKKKTARPTFALSKFDECFVPVDMAPAAFAAMCLEQGSGSLRLTQDKESCCEILS